MESEPTEQPNWNLDQISRDLQSSFEVAESPIFRHGASYEVGAAHPTNLEVFPTTAHIDVRVRKLLMLGLSQINLVGSDPYGGVIASAEDAGGKAILWLQPNGGFTLVSSEIEVGRPPR